MKYLISGQNGFIGQATTKYLEDRYHYVVGIPRNLLFKSDELKAFIEAENPDYIIHLAAYGNHSFQQDDAMTIEVNITGTYNLLEASKGVPYKTFYNISTSSVYLPVQTMYSATKFGAERIANAFKIKYGKNIVNVRPYSVYGEGEADFRFIPTVIRCLETGDKMILDEHATHDWIYIQDYIVGMLEGKPEVGRGISSTNLTVVKMLEEISGKKLNYEKGILRKYDNNQWRASHSVEHSLSLREGLKRTYDYERQKYRK